MSKNRYVFYSMVFLPSVLVILVVYLVNIGIQSYGSSVTAAAIDPLILQSMQVLVYIPAIITVLIGSTSVVIEKNNKSLEPLLATPISDAELLLGKSLAPFLPAMVVTYAAYAVAIGSIDYLGYSALHVILLPSALLILELAALVPVLGLFGTFVSLFLSSKVKDVRAAQQVSSFTIIPLLVVFGVLSAYISSDLLLFELVILALALAVVGLALLTIKRFRRESILVDWS